MSQVYQIADRNDTKALSQYLSQSGQLLLPMVELIEQAQMAAGQFVDVLGHAALEGLLELSAQQIAGPEIAAVRRVMGDHLRRRPVEIAGVAEAQAMRRKAFGAHLSRRQPHFEFEREPAFLLVRRIVEIGQRPGIVRRARKSGRAEGRERLRRDDPRRDRGVE